MLAMPSMKAWPWLLEWRRSLLDTRSGYQASLHCTLIIFVALTACTPMAPIDYVNSGGAKFRQRDYCGAIEEYGKAIELEPDIPQTYQDRARAFEGMGDYGRAIEDYDEVIRLGLGIATIFTARGTAFVHNKKYDLAIADFNRAIARGVNILDLNLGTRNLGSTYFNRALAFMLRNNDGDAERAIADFREVLRVSANRELRSAAEKQLEELGAMP
jgi:tetratricopeptide (TPR) repeat protein